MISQRHKNILVRAGEEVSVNQWMIADTALEIVNELVEQYPQYRILVEIGRWCGLGARRVGKLMRVAQVFPYDMRDPRWVFGYYERALDFGDDAHNAIEFLSFYAEEYGKSPTIRMFGIMFRQHILGEVTSYTPEYELPAPDRPISEYRVHIDGLRELALRRCPSHTAQEIIRLLDRIEGYLIDSDTQLDSASPIESNTVGIVA